MTDIISSLFDIDIYAICLLFIDAISFISFIDDYYYLLPHLFDGHLLLHCRYRHYADITPMMPFIITFTLITPLFHY